MFVFCCFLPPPSLPCRFSSFALHLPFVAPAFSPRISLALSLSSPLLFANASPPLRTPPLATANNPNARACLRVDGRRRCQRRRLTRDNNKQAARPNPHDGFGGLGGGGFDGPHGRNAQVTIRLLVPLAAGKYLGTCGSACFASLGLLLILLRVLFLCLWYTCSKKSAGKKGDVVSYDAGSQYSPPPPPSTRER